MIDWKELQEDFNRLDVWQRQAIAFMIDALLDSRKEKAKVIQMDFTKREPTDNRAGR